jgi:serine protease Do
LRNAEVYFPSAKEGSKGPYRTALANEDTRRDLAILAVDVPLSPLEVARDYRFKRGEEVTIIGNPGVKFIGTVIPNAVTRGIFSAEIVWKGHRYYQLGASVNHGNSGGPALDSAGRVIGVVTLKAQEEAIGFCIPAQDLITTLATLRTTSPRDFKRVGRKHDVASVFYLLREVSSLYCRGLEVYVARMDASVQRGGSADDGLRQAGGLIVPALAQKDRELSGDIKSELPDMVQDPDLPAETRQGLRELWNTYTDMKSYVEEPRGTYQSFRTKVLDLKDRFNHTVKDLELRLGIEADD